MTWVSSHMRPSREGNQGQSVTCCLRHSRKPNSAILTARKAASTNASAAVDRWLCLLETGMPAAGECRKLAGTACCVRMTVIITQWDYTYRRHSGPLVLEGNASVLMRQPHGDQLYGKDRSGCTW